MTIVAKLVALLALVIILGPCVLFCLGSASLSSVHASAFLGTVLWFVSAPFWLIDELPLDADQVEI